MSNKQPAAYINLEIYEDSINLLGVAKVQLPAIAFPCVNISGAGMMGEMEVPLYSMVSNMTTTPGTVAPMASADTSSGYVVYYFAAYKNGEQLWEVDKRNMRCVILGVDYMAEVRKALGK